MSFSKSDYITILNKSQSYIDSLEKEVTRIGEGLHELFRDYKGETVTVTVKQDPPDVYSNTSNGSFVNRPVYNFLVMPKKAGEKCSAVDVNICFNDAVYKFSMKWEDEK